MRCCTYNEYGCTRYKYFNTYKEYIKAVLVISTKSKILIMSKLVISSTYNEFELLAYKYKNTYKGYGFLGLFISIKLKYFNTFNEYSRTRYKYNTSNTYNECTRYK